MHQPLKSRSPTELCFVWADRPLAENITQSITGCYRAFGKRVVVVVRLPVNTCLTLQIPAQKTHAASSLPRQARPRSDTAWKLHEHLGGYPNRAPQQRESCPGAREWRLTVATKLAGRTLTPSRRRCRRTGFHRYPTVRAANPARRAVGFYGVPAPMWGSAPQMAQFAVYDLLRRGAEKLASLEHVPERCGVAGALGPRRDSVAVCSARHRPGIRSGTPGRD